MRDYGLATIHTTQVPFLVNLDTLLRLVGSPEVQVSWPLAPMNYMVAAYTQLESLFLLYTQWFYCLKSTIVGVEIVDMGPLALITIQVNPQVSFTLKIIGAIIELKRQWEGQVMAALGPDHHVSLYLNWSTELPAVLFQSSSAVGTSQQAKMASLESNLCPASHSSAVTFQVGGLSG
jgi:hypothetical protein